MVPVVVNTCYTCFIRWIRILSRLSGYDPTHYHDQAVDKNITEIIVLVQMLTMLTYQPQSHNSKLSHFFGNKNLYMLKGGKFLKKQRCCDGGRV